MAQSTPPEPATGLTAELVVSTWHPSDVRLSPDGCRVAWSATPYGRSEKHGESALWVVSTDGSEPARRWTYNGAASPKSGDQARLWQP